MQPGQPPVVRGHRHPEHVGGDCRLHSPYLVYRHGHIPSDAPPGTSVPPLLPTSRHQRGRRHWRHDGIYSGPPPSLTPRYWRCTFPADRTSGRLMPTVVIVVRTGIGHIRFPNVHRMFALWAEPTSTVRYPRRLPPNRFKEPKSLAGRQIGRCRQVSTDLSGRQRSQILMILWKKWMSRPIKRGMNNRISRPQHLTRWFLTQVEGHWRPFNFLPPSNRRGKPRTNPACRKAER
jgi:hypothetical protein